MANFPSPLPHALALNGHRALAPHAYFNKVNKLHRHRRQFLAIASPALPPFPRSHHRRKTPRRLPAFIAAMALDFISSNRRAPIAPAAAHSIPLDKQVRSS